MIYYEFIQGSDQKSRVVTLDFWPEWCFIVVIITELQILSNVTWCFVFNFLKKSVNLFIKNKFIQKCLCLVKSSLSMYRILKIIKKIVILCHKITECTNIIIAIYAFFFYLKSYFAFLKTVCNWLHKMWYCKSKMQYCGKFWI